MRNSILFSFCLTLIFSSCTMAPRVANHNYSVQEKMESVAHWQALANEVVETQVLPSLPINPDLAKVYIDKSDTTEFGKAFYQYLSTALINYGVMETQSREDANSLMWGTQLVKSSKDPWAPGIIAGILEGAAFLIVGSSVILPPNDIELIITTQISRENMVLTKVIHNYYIDNSSKWNFYQGKSGTNLARR